jgi:N6-L-threonylcarbamoyladenine synthase
LLKVFLTLPHLSKFAILWYSSRVKILSIETSCDETGISILSLQGSTIEVLGNALASQIELHAQYGGVFPAMAKRAHAEKVTFLIEQALSDSELLEAVDAPVAGVAEQLAFLDDKEMTLKEHIVPFLTYYAKPDIDYIAVTVGPGLEPALWVGINAARALSTIWNIPIIPINHMEGHIVTTAIQPDETENSFASQAETSTQGSDLGNYSLSKRVFTFKPLTFPLLSLLVSGGHTELVLVNGFGEYEKIGQTRDDAVGEAFDKVARMLGLSYPGGPAISRLAKEFREKNVENTFTLPRPMMHSGDFDFSFSGIKTAALYAIRDLTKGSPRSLTEDEKIALACAFEDAVVEVLVHKTMKAAMEHHAQTIIVGGGVAANAYLREELTKAVLKKIPDTHLLFPEAWLATDNAVMIGLAAMTQVISGEIKKQLPENLKADGNLSL